MNSAVSEAISADALVIGAGPAGLAAATRLKSLGIGRVIAVDRELQAGGVPRHCGHPPFGMREFGRVLTGPVYARRLAERAQRAGVELLLGHSVVAISRDERIVVTCASSRGSICIRARRVILATGVRETPRSARLDVGRQASWRSHYRSAARVRLSAPYQAIPPARHCWYGAGIALKPADVPNDRCETCRHGRT